MITVIGLGEVGFETFKDICKKRDDVFGVEIEKSRLEELREKGFDVGVEIPLSEIYLICVYLTEHAVDIIKKIDFSNNPLIVIESTVMPGTYREIMEWKTENKLDFDLVLFPHRYNPNDPEHHVFNLDRAIGGSKRALERALGFYKGLMPLDLIHKTTPEIAELTKPLENAYRFVEIAVAEELRLLCHKREIDFDHLRRIMNTKWNIEVREARGGIGGKCLPKDISLVNNFFSENSIFSTAIKVDKAYKEVFSKKDGKNEKSKHRG